ncbi:hypothetical protein OIU77_001058 [Salix suchowensis]|uniref:Uncharacterized protein n=1 Tax=Salix suchowensis TaxID=1278906 RepID=A0ABQ9BA56_9ROSI|nr:hypothetical protein OIU77_001058 [Salix suchowensis]
MDEERVKMVVLSQRDKDRIMNLTSVQIRRRAIHRRRPISEKIVMNMNMEEMKEIERAEGEDTEEVFISIALILGDGLYNFLKILYFTARSMHARAKVTNSKQMRMVLDIPNRSLIVLTKISKFTRTNNKKGFGRKAEENWGIYKGCGDDWWIDGTLRKNSVTYEKYMKS